MQRGMPVFRFAAKVLSQSATAVLATLLGGYVIAFLNVKSSDPSQPAKDPAPAMDQRALTREYVKALREGHPEGSDDVAEVRPTAPPAPAGETVLPKAAPREAAIRAAAPARKESRLRAEPAAAPVATLEAAGSAPPVAAQSVAAQPVIASIPATPPVAAPPEVAQANAAPPLGAPIVLAPANVASVDTVNAPQAGPTDAPQAVAAPPREHKTVFSAISTLIGHAANATGDSINFVIDLPGRALGGSRDRAAEAPTPVRNQPPVSGGTAAPMQYTGS